MRRRIFDDLLDMQEEANRFFEEVYRRLALFETALSNWPLGRMDRSNRVEASNQQIYTNQSRRAVVSERYQQRAIYQQQPQRSLPENSSDYYDNYEDSDYEYSDYNEYDNYYDNSQRAIEENQRTNKAISGNTTNSRNLPVQITENQSNVLARVELPGLKRGDINVSVAGDKLVIEGKVHRTISLPQGADPSQIRASYKNGTLEVRLPRQNRKRIPVEFE